MSAPQGAVSWSRVQRSNDMRKGGVYIGDRPIAVGVRKGGVGTHSQHVRL